MATTRSLWLIAALGLTLVATWYAAGLQAPADDAPVAQARVPQRPAAGTTDAAARPNPAAAPGAASRMAQASANLFAPRSWQPPPAPPPVAPSPAAPEPLEAPPLPFKYLGRLEEAGTVAVFLAEGNQHPRLVRKGDQLPNYRVDDITAEAMQLTYLPLNQTQSLPFGTAP